MQLLPTKAIRWTKDKSHSTAENRKNQSYFRRLDLMQSLETFFL